VYPLAPTIATLIDFMARMKSHEITCLPTLKSSAFLAPRSQSGL
jgi:hypothetical protein